MKMSFAALVLLVTGSSALAAPVSPGDAGKYLGQRATIHGTVSEVRTASDGAVFLEMGGKYPDDEMSAVILPRSSGAFENVQGYAGQTVNITGRIELYRGKPQIELDGIGQIEVLRAAQARRIL